MRRRVELGVLALLLGRASTLPAGAADDDWSSGCGRSENLVREQQQEIKQPARRAEAAEGDRHRDAAAGRARRGAARRPPRRRWSPSIPEWVNQDSPRSATSAIRHEGFYDQRDDGERRPSTRATARRGSAGASVRSTPTATSCPRRSASRAATRTIRSRPTRRSPASFTRKHVNLDWAYLTVAPGKTLRHPARRSSTVNAGKFPNPMFRVGRDGLRRRPLARGHQRDGPAPRAARSARSTR